MITETLPLSGTVTTPGIGSGSGLLGRYYDTSTFTDLRLVRTDATIDFDWGMAAPTPTAFSDGDSFSVRWTGAIEALTSESYTFFVNADDRARLTINGQLVIALGDTQGTIALVAGQHASIVLEYVEDAGAAHMTLEWASPAVPRQHVPTSQLYPEPLPTPITGTGTGITGRYYDTDTFSDLRLLRTDASVDFDWGYDPPAASGFTDGDTFSVRWTGDIQPRYSGTYSFYATSDETVQVVISGTVVIDATTPHGQQEDQGTITLVAGQHYPITIAYGDGDGAASMRLEWSSDTQPREDVPASQLYPAPLPTPITGTGTGLLGTYYDNPDLTTPLAYHPAEAVHFDWGDGVPDPAFSDANTFSVRWSGEIAPRFTGPLTFFTTSDDGVRLWVNNTLIIDDWTNRGLLEQSGTITLTAGVRVPIVRAYFDDENEAVARLDWSSTDQLREVVPPSQLYAAIAPTPTATATNTPVPPTATRTNTPVPPTATRTNTPVPSTATRTNTPVPPTATRTNTPVPPTATRTNTPVPPTATRTNTPLPPTATRTNTPVPPTATRTNTLVPPTATRTNTLVPPTATRTNTPVPPTATRTNTPVPPTATRTATRTRTPVGGFAALAAAVPAAPAAADHELYLPQVVQDGPAPAHASAGMASNAWSVPAKPTAPTPTTATTSRAIAPVSRSTA